MLPLHCKRFIRIYNIHIINVRFLMIKGYFIEIQFSNNHINDTPHQCSEHVLTLTRDANGEYLQFIITRNSVIIQIICYYMYNYNVNYFCHIYPYYMYRVLISRFQEAVWSTNKTQTLNFKIRCLTLLTFIQKRNIPHIFPLNLGIFLYFHRELLF